MRFEKINVEAKPCSARTSFKQLIDFLVTKLFPENLGITHFYFLFGKLAVTTMKRKKKYVDKLSWLCPSSDLSVPRRRLTYDASITRKTS